ncbi:hypothetical protein CU102_16620 [Phyllobacterium brassicacearum]|uniref:Uncharacterized protein n=1 Tax=Phyllobacterium brassicacearum TaxID=314235 RepID=A0A2P7BMZ0_9HYPH|nr:hypothetical protein CU102_16620 [Phyllobacterium brassicacearum]TDQ27374.1 hypothetical protein DEV91_11295 [Phyllobacterium brassicacearum]
MFLPDGGSMANIRRAPRHAELFCFIRLAIPLRRIVYIWLTMRAQDFAWQNGVSIQPWHRPPASGISTKITSNEGALRGKRLRSYSSRSRIDYDSVNALGAGMLETSEPSLQVMVKLHNW